MEHVLAAAETAYQLRIVAWLVFGGEPPFDAEILTLAPLLMLRPMERSRARGRLA